MGRSSSQVRDAIAQRQQTVRKVDVLELDGGVRAGQLDVGEVPEPAHAQRRQPVRRFLRHVLGDGQRHHVHRMGADERFQLVHREDGDAVDDRSDQGGGDVERGVHREAGLGEGEVLQKRVAQIARADHDEVVVFVHAQNVPDLRAQLFYVVAVALLAKLAEAAEILTNLGGGDVHLLSQRMGGDAHHAAGVETVELAVISWQAPDHSVGDVFLLQKDALFPKYLLNISQNLV